MNWSKFKTKKFYAVVALVVVVLIVILPVALYVYNPSAKLTQSIFKTLPYPVAIIDGRHVITTRTLLADTDAIKHFYETQDFSSAGLRVDFSTEEGQLRIKIKEKEILDKLIEDIIVRKTAEERGIVVSEGELQKKIADLNSNGGSLETFEQNIKKLYGWDLEQSKNKVLLPQLYLEKLIDYYIAKEKDNGEDWKKIQEAKSKISENGSNFCDVVSSYSEGDGVKENCGEVGWFEEKHLEPEIATTAFSMKTGEVSDVIKSSLGYHVILLDEIRQTEKDGKKITEVKLKQIFIANGGFVEWLREEKKKHQVWILMKDYQWNKDKASVRFRSNQLETKEQFLRIKSEGDPIFY